MMDLFGGGQMPEGMPIPRPPKEYSQNYFEGVLRFLITIPLAIIFSFLNISIGISCLIWSILYIILIVIMGIKNILKQFAIGYEISLFFQYLIAHTIIYVMTNNAIQLFK